MKKYISVVASVVLASSMIVGCSGGGSGGGLVHNFNGVFVDTHVGGIDWDCNTLDLGGHVSGYTGTTGADGVFGPCREDSIVKFSVGNLFIGSTRKTSNNIVTPADFGNLQAAPKIASFLLSMDADGDPSNGIDINSTTRADVDNRFSAGSDIQAMSQAAVDSANAALAPVAPVSVSDAEQHLRETEKKIAEGEIAEPEQPPANTGGSGGN